MDRSPCVSRDCRVECVIDPIHARLAESLWPAQRRDREITPAWSPSVSDGVRHAAALSGGRSWWTHHEFTRINIEPTFQKEEFEEVREGSRDLAAASLRILFRRGEPPAAVPPPPATEPSSRHSRRAAPTPVPCR